MVTVIIVIALAAIICFWIIGVQRQLISRDEMCKNSLSQIGVQQSSRWDALSAIADLVKSYNAHEAETLKAIIAQRSTISGNSLTSDADRQEGMIAQALGRIAVVAEQYPNLKADTNYGRAIDSINSYENQVRMSRMVFNDSVTRYNEIVRSFPSSIVAGMFHFSPKEYLQEVAAKADMPSMKI